MASQIPVTFRAAPLPYNWKGTPSQFLSALVSRLAMDSQEQIALVNVGSVAPTSDIGPWLKNGTEWYVWSSGSGAYVPQTISALTALDPKPFRGNSAGPQTLSYTIPATKTADLILTEIYDPGFVFDSSTFTAPVTGYYHIDCKVGLSPSSTALTDNIVNLNLKLNGASIAQEQVFNFVPIPEGGYTLSISTDLQLTAGDQIKANVSIEVLGVAAPATWTITENDTWLSGFKIKSA